MLSSLAFCLARQKIVKRYERPMIQLLLQRVFRRNHTLEAQGPVPSQKRSCATFVLLETGRIL